MANLASLNTREKILGTQPVLLPHQPPPHQEIPTNWENWTPQLLQDEGRLISASLVREKVAETIKSLETHWKAQINAISQQYLLDKETGQAELEHCQAQLTLLQASKEEIESKITSYQTDNTTLQNDLNHLEEANLSLKSKIAEQTTVITGLSTRILHLNEQVEIIHSQNAALTTQMEEQQLCISQLQFHKNKLQIDLDDLNTQKFNLQEQLTHQQIQLTQLDSQNKGMQEKIISLDQKKQELESLISEHTTKITQQQQTFNELQQLYDELSELQIKNKTEITSLRNTMQVQQEQTQKLQLENVRIQAALEQGKEAIARLTEEFNHRREVLTEKKETCSLNLKQKNEEVLTLRAQMNQKRIELEQSTLAFNQWSECEACRGWSKVGLIFLAIIMAPTIVVPMKAADSLHEVDEPGHVLETTIRQLSASLAEDERTAESLEGAIQTLTTKLSKLDTKLSILSPTLQKIIGNSYVPSGS